MSAPTLTIDPEFADLCPPLTADERKHLEDSIAADGCREAVVTWHGVIVDGHNRHAICTAWGLDFPTAEHEFPDRHAAVEWIVRNQLGRRNISDYVRTQLALHLKPALEEKARGRQKTSTGGAEPQLVANLPQAARGKVRDEVARTAGVSSRTVSKVETIEKEASPEVKEAARKGEKSIDAAYKEVRPPRPRPDKKPAAAPAPHVNGTTKVNGVVRPDPPDIAAARAAGKIGPDVVPEVTEPGPANGTHAEEEAKADLTEAEWLATLPVRGKLPGGLVRKFDIDALSYRRLEPARKTFAHHVARLAKGDGAYAWKARYFLKIQHPRDWTLCCKPEDGGCGGKGVVGLIGQCVKCQGRGYWIM